MSFTLWSCWVVLTLLTLLCARLLDRTRALMVGGGALALWGVAAIFLVDVSATVQVAGVLSGAGLLALMTFVLSAPAQAVEVACEPVEVESKHADSLDAPDDERNAALAKVPQAFDEWLASHRDLADPWPDFGEFVRASLYACCGAAQIKAYRLLSPDDNALLPLHETSPNEQDFPPLRSGIRGHVATSGNSYYANGPGDDALHALASQGDQACVWCFPVHVHRNLIGVIQVGELPDSSAVSSTRLRLVEGVVALCWGALTEACRSRISDDTDSVAGVLTPEAFLNLAGRTLKEAYSKNEPLAVVSFNIEGLRGLTDQGHWELAKDAVRRASEIIRERIREDDCAGFFDGSRFVVVLHRVDVELARLIVKKIQGYIRTVFASLGPAQNCLDVRCGVAVSGESKPALNTLVSWASSSCTTARKQGMDMFVRSEEQSEVGAQ